MAQLLGTSSADTIDGTASSDVIYGNQGADDLAGLAGNDTLYGGSGEDSLSGNSGDDLILGGRNDDFIFGDEGNDLVFGGSGNDNIGGDSGNDYVSGDLGDDALFGADISASNPGNGEIDTLIGGGGSDTFFLGSGISERSYYKGSGNGDFALIVDFEVGKDLLAVYGGDTYNLANLSLPGFGSGVGVVVTTGGQTELISFLPGFTSNQLSLTRDFIYL